MNLTKQETATVLVALRMLQTRIVILRRDLWTPSQIRKVFQTEGFTQYDDAKPLMPEQIDALCERINFDGEPRITHDAPRVVIAIHGGTASRVEKKGDPIVIIEVRDYDIDGLDDEFEKDSDGDEYRAFTL